jgi:hypothetical protein
MTFDRRDTPRLMLAALRSVGGGAFLLPRVGSRTFGLPDDAESSYLVRLFAARNIAFTAGLLASNGSARRLWWQAGVVCDALDAGAGLLGLREGKERSSAMVDTGASLVAAGLGVAGLLVDEG